MATKKAPMPKTEDAVAALQRDVSALQTEVDSLTEQLGHATDENGALKTRIKELEDKLAAVRPVDPARMAPAAGHSG